MRELGVQLSSRLIPGDLIALTGPLGAGKTLLTQGIAAGLGIIGVTSPTFVIAREYEGPIPLIHVDAYRLLENSTFNLEFDDLDLVTRRDEAITIVEWGRDIAPRLGDEYLEIVIDFGITESERNVSAIGHGARWQGFSL